MQVIYPLLDRAIVRRSIALKFSRVALEALQEASEAYIVSLVIEELMKISKSVFSITYQCLLSLFQAELFEEAELVADYAKTIC